jgi:hypothetical protein
LGKKFRRIAVIADTLPFGGPIDGLLGMDILCPLKAKITTVSGMIEVEKNRKHPGDFFLFFSMRWYSRLAGYRSVFVLEISSASKQLELLERLELLEQASLRCVQSDGGLESAGQTENSFQQSQTILRDLKHHSLPHFSHQTV